MQKYIIPTIMFATELSDTPTTVCNSDMPFVIKITPKEEAIAQSGFIFAIHTAIIAVKPRFCAVSEETV